MISFTKGEEEIRNGFPKKHVLLLNSKMYLPDRQDQGRAFHG